MVDGETEWGGEGLRERWFQVVGERECRTVGDWLCNEGLFDLAHTGILQSAKMREARLPPRTNVHTCTPIHTYPHPDCVVEIKQSTVKVLEHSSHCQDRLQNSHEYCTSLSHRKSSSRL